MASVLQASPRVSMSKPLKSKSARSESSLNLEKGDSKRLRVTLFSHAEVVDDDGISRSSDTTSAAGAKNSAHVVDCEMEHPTTTLRKGLRVRLQGLQARPQLNGQTGQILAFYASQSRWLVSLDGDGSKKFVLGTNLQPEALPAASTDVVAKSMGDDISGAAAVLAEVSKDAGRNASDVTTALPPRDASRNASDMTAAVPPQDYLKATLEATKMRASRSVEEVSGKACAEVWQLRSEVQDLSRLHHRRFLGYCAMSKPTNYKEQSARNNVRKQLQEVAQTLQSKMQRLIDSSKEPAASLRAAKVEEFDAIDGMVNMLMDFRRERAETYEEYDAKVNVDRRAAEAGISSLAPAIENVDKFVKCFAEEVQCEKKEADCVHRDLVDKLEKQETIFVGANDSPSRSPRFKKVQEDLAACKRLVEEGASNEVLNTTLMQSWDSLLKAMPSKKQPEPELPRRRLWSRLKCASRTASSS